MGRPYSLDLQDWVVAAPSAFLLAERHNASYGVNMVKKDSEQGLLTLGEIGKRLARLAFGDASQVMRRVRHWTNDGLLKPADELHSGTGRPRRYAIDQLYRAAILLELSRFGVPVGILHEALEWIDIRRNELIDKEGVDPFEVAATGKEPIRVVFTLIRGRDGEDHGWVGIGFRADVVLPHFGGFFEIELGYLLSQLQ